MPKFLSNEKKVIKYFKPNKEGKSEWKSIDDLKKYSLLKWSSNGNGRYGIFFGVKKWKWDVKRIRGPTSTITHLRLNGFNECKIDKLSRPIGTNIKKEHKDKPCVFCGTKTNLIYDHKNDLYNNPRVLNSKTQTVDDFQSVCNSCNLRKRAVCKKTRESGERYAASNIPHLKPLGIDFTRGDKTYDKNDPNAMVGTYYYDPVQFLEDAIKKILEDSEKRIEDLNQKLKDSEKRIKELNQKLKNSEKRIEELNQKSEDNKISNDKIKDI